MRLKVDARKGCRIRKLPPVLMLHLKRFTFDYVVRRHCRILNKIAAQLQPQSTACCLQKQVVLQL